MNRIGLGLLGLLLALAMSACSHSVEGPEGASTADSRVDGNGELPPRLQGSSEAPYPPRRMTELDQPFLEEARDLTLEPSGAEGSATGTGAAGQPDPEPDELAMIRDSTYTGGLTDEERRMIEPERYSTENDPPGVDPLRRSTPEDSARYAALVPRRSPFAVLSELRPIFFDFDQDQLASETQEILDRNAAWMLAHPEVRVRVEGHCDERGTPAYNLALGQRRANRVVRYLLAKGIPRDGMLAVSFGEEVPTSYRHDETSWRQNRRVEFSYLEDRVGTESTSLNNRAPRPLH